MKTFLAFVFLLIAQLVILAVELLCFALISLAVFLGATAFKVANTLPVLRVLIFRRV